MPAILYILIVILLLLCFSYFLRLRRLRARISRLPVIMRHVSDRLRFQRS